MSLNNENQQKLMEMVVGKVLQKHQVDASMTKLTDEEKSNIKNIVENIQYEVEKFLQRKKVTEKDFADNSTAEIQPFSSPSLSSPKRKTFHTENNPGTVKTFLNNFKKK